MKYIHCSVVLVTLLLESDISARTNLTGLKHLITMFVPECSIRVSVITFIRYTYSANIGKANNLKVVRSTKIKGIKQEG
jgi:nitric oxide synthase oxygenase domain/subunit